MTGSPFHSQIRQEYDRFLLAQEQRFPVENRLKIDLHCHDLNSDVPDELWGRLLKLPETWLPSNKLLERLNDAGADLMTVTNHNNARSCWVLMDKGLDILSGAEFTCHFPNDSLSIHVLAYGFSPAQEMRLNKLRFNIFQFQAYALEQDIPTVLPHPLFFYTAKKKPNIELLEKFALLFERFEVLNGQRGYWQNHLTQRWVASLTDEKITELAHKHKINPADFCAHPFNKCMTGGSDDHNGIFAGECGTFLHVDNLAERRISTPLSQLALEALRKGYTAPYGEPGEEERLTTAFLDYFAQVTLNMEDPGLLRLMLHKGRLQDKVMCLAVSNAMQELQRHKYTLGFLKTFHQALHGQSPALWKSLGVSKAFKPTLKIIKDIAKARQQQPKHFTATLRQTLPALYREVTQVFVDRLEHEILSLPKKTLKRINAQTLIEHFELPTSFRSLFNNSYAKHPRMTDLNIFGLLDQVTFPALATLVIGGASFAGSQVLYANRDFLNDLAEDLQEGQHSKRVLWLTDSFSDANGVSSVLQSTLAHVQAHELPIDMLICHPTQEAQAHLHVLKPMKSFSIPSLSEQTLYIPDMLEVQTLFEVGGYDRIICSTELVMGLIALYLKKAFSVPTYFYMHTDWNEFFKRSAALDAQSSDRLRRLLRFFYQQYDGLFVLNSDHKAWLASDAMDFPIERLYSTQHWIDARYVEAGVQRGAKPPGKTLLFAGRISREKGVLDLPGIFAAIKTLHPDAQLLIAGKGPALKKLQKRMPDACYLGWVEKDKLASLYLQADLLLLPSRFDTFGCVVLEAMATGLPVVAYNVKGPKDIIQHGINSFTAENATEMAQIVCQYLHWEPQARQTLQKGAQLRETDYRASDIMAQLMLDVGLEPAHLN